MIHKFTIIHQDYWNGGYIKIDYWYSNIKLKHYNSTTHHFQPFLIIVYIFIYVLECLILDDLKYNISIILRFNYKIQRVRWFGRSFFKYEWTLKMYLAWCKKTRTINTFTYPCSILQGKYITDAYKFTIVFKW